MGVRASGVLIVLASLIALVIIIAACAPISFSQAISQSAGTTAPDYSFGSSSLLNGLGAFVCSEVESFGSCIAQGDLTNGVIGGGGCTPDAGPCWFINESFSATYYTYNAGDGEIIRSPLSGTVTNPIPVISEVIQTNNKYSPYLITCPVSPQPTNSIEYISDPGTFIAGNRCLASVLPLLTMVSLTTSWDVVPFGYFINWGFTTSDDGSAPVMGFSQPYAISGFAKGNLKNLAYSGQASVKGSAYNISGSYNTKSYIFQNINSTPQQGLWTWTVDYANLANQDLSYLHLNYSSADDSMNSDLTAYYGGIDWGISTEFEIPIYAPIFVLCSFSYSYIVNSQITNLANANVPIPIYNTTAAPSSKDYVTIGQYSYSPVKTVSPGGNTCFDQMLAGGPSCLIGGSPSCKKQTASRFSCIPASYGFKISDNGTAYYQGQIYNNLPVYLNVTNTLDINQLGSSVNGNRFNIFRKRTIVPNTALTTQYYVPVPTGGTATLLTTNTVVGVDFKNVTIFPYFTYNATIPSTFSQFTAASFLNLSYAIYSPNNYASTTNAFGGLTTPVEPYNIFTGAGMLVNYSTPTRKSEISAFPYSVSAASANTYYDEFPLAVGAPIVLQPIPSTTQTSSMVIVGSGSAIPPQYLQVDTIIYITGGSPTPQSGLSACTDNFFAGTCAGDVSFTISGDLTSNTEIFGNIGISPGAIINTNGYFLMTNGIISNQDQIQTPDGNPAPESTPDLSGVGTATGGTTPLQTAIPQHYPANTIYYVTAQIAPGTVVGTSPIQSCYDNMAAGYCLGNVNYYQQVTLGGNLFVFGNVIMQPGGVLLLNGHTLITNEIISDTSNILSNYKILAPSSSDHGTIAITNITNPAFVAESPNGYVYVINYSQGSSFFHLSTTTSSYIFKLKYIPTGDYNYSVFQPSEFPTQPTLGKWLNQSENYFRASLLAQTPSLYIVSATQFTQSTVPNWCLFGQHLCLGGSATGSGASKAPFLPLAAAADYGGDLFLVGAPIPNSNYYGKSSNPTFALAELSTSGQTIVQTNLNIAAGDGLVPSDEMAVSPGGEYVYLANASFPNINIYSTQGGTFSYVGNIPLSYSNSSYNMNIIAYLSHGGPFDSKVIQGGFGFSYQTATMNDIPQFHHPLAITDVQGTIFVLDNWTFGTDTGSSSYTPSGPEGETYTEYSSTFTPIGSIWMFRAFQDNGTVELPIGYSTNKTTAPVSAIPQEISPFASTATASSRWPPYGWPLSANLTPQSGTAFTICESCGTMAGPQGRYGSIPGLKSTGPQISAYGQLFGSRSGSVSTPEDLGITSDLNGNIYLLIHDHISTTPYTQLLVLNPQLENYTNLDIGAEVPFQCYSNVVGLPDCIPANFIGGFYPPLLGVPDAFEHLTAQGSQLQYFSVPSALSSLLPTGANSATTTKNTISTFNSGSTGGVDLNCLASGGAGCGSSTPYTPGQQLRTYLNSMISGYVITPYTITYTKHITYDFQTGTEEMEINPLNAQALDSELCDFNPSPESGKTTLYTAQVTKLGSSFINQTIEGGGVYGIYNNTQTNYQPNLSDQNLVIPPQIAYNIFSNRLFGEIYINQTISPTTANSMASLLESYLLNSAGGSLSSLVGQFACTFGVATNCPLVVNATRNYNYAEDIFIQVYLPTVNGGFNPFNSGIGSSLSSFNSILSTGVCGATNICAPAYDAENALPTGPTPNNTIMGANCGGSCPTSIPGQIGQITGTNPLSSLPPQIGQYLFPGYYYSSLSSSYLNGNSNFTYNYTYQTNYFNLFSIFRRMSNLYSLGLNLSNTPSVYGYNRLLYTYIDRYNNTLYMPVDIDLANITQVSLQTKTAVNTINVNQSQINITGNLTYLKPDGTLAPAPAGSNVYLYYDANINFYNASMLTTLAGATGQLSELVSGSYYKWAENCAFDPQSSSCVLANPLSTFGIGSLLAGVSGIPSQSPQSLQDLAVTSLGYLTDTPTYAPNYGSAGSCPLQPNSLLALTQYTCNIHGSAIAGAVPGLGDFLGLPATGAGPLGNQQYCVPQYTNGTGYLTSQLGLIGIVQTNAAGGFNDVITACGTDTGRIIAQYYGSPGPEPINVAQTLLSRSVTPLSSNTANDIISPEYNYYYSPNETSATFQIGSYQLSLGNLYAWVPIIIILILLLASKSALGQSGGIFELFGFSTMYSVAAGAAAGAGRKGTGLSQAYRTDAVDRYRNPIFDRNDDRVNANKYLKEIAATMPPPPSAPQFPGNIYAVNAKNIGNILGPGAGGIGAANFHEFLGMPKKPATLEEARAAWIKQRSIFRSDLDKGDATAQARVQAINRAYEVAKANLASAAVAGGMVHRSTNDSARRGRLLLGSSSSRAGTPSEGPESSEFRPMSGSEKLANKMANAPYTKIGFDPRIEEKIDGKLDRNEISVETLRQTYLQKKEELEAEKNQKYKDFRAAHQKAMADLKKSYEEKGANIQTQRDEKEYWATKRRYQRERNQDKYFHWVGSTRQASADLREVERSWAVIKRRRGITDLPKSSFLPPPSAPG